MELPAKLRLWEGNTGQFIEDTIQNQIADKLKASFLKYKGFKPTDSEVASWVNSLQFLKNSIEYNALNDLMIILEYDLPYSTNRIDAMLFGKGTDQTDNVVVLELKQWSEVKDCDVEGNVKTFLGRAERMVAHPSFQVRGYHYYLSDFLEVFNQSPQTSLSSCVYAHNYSTMNEPVLLYPKFRPIIEQFPVFGKEDFGKLGDYLKARLSVGKGLEIYSRFLMSGIRPSKKLIDHTKDMVGGQQIFNLIDDQIAANNTIIDRAKKSAKLKKKSVIIIQGGPGTGKSVIALNALAELLSMNLVVYHATGSAAFTKTLRKLLGYRVGRFFKFFNSFSHKKTKENEIDVLICDEAHRIRETSNDRYTPSEFRSEMRQVDELIRVAKVSIFFVDDYQVVRPTEIGSSKMIREAAEKVGAEIFDFELKTQFRCSGSDGYLNWIDNTLAIRETANPTLTRSDKMEFKIFDSPQTLYEAIKKKNEEKPNSARLVAGFCWTWSDPNPDGTLKEDVIIGDFRMPWEGKEGKKLAKGIPEAPYWAFDPEGVNQIGSIYTIQGFEFEYVGVIFAKDLVYDPVSKGWKADSKNSSDPQVKRAKEEDFIRYVKNVYRTLLTRGMKGCYVYFMDENTRKFVESRLLAT